MTERGKQIVHMNANITLVGIIKACDVTLDFNARGPSQRTEVSSSDYCK